MFIKHVQDMIRCILVCIYAQLQHTTDIHEPRKKKRDQLLFEYIEIGWILNIIS